MKHKRRIKIVDKKLQYQFLLTVVASGASIYLISALQLRLLSSKILEILGIVDIRSDIALNIIRNVNVSGTILLGLSSLTLIITWIAALYLSHRIAGPVYHINRVLDERLAGNKEIRIHTRKNDFFSDLVKKINALLDEGNSKKS